MNDVLIYIGERSVIGNEENEWEWCDWVPCSLLDSEEDDSDITETGDLGEEKKYICC
jgi:hypothetical protein